MIKSYLDGRLKGQKFEKGGTEQMEQRMTQGEQNLILLQSIIPRTEKLYVWCYNENGNLVASSCPVHEQSLLDHSFRALGGLDQALAFAHSGDAKGPQIIGSSIGMQWAVTFETERKQSLIFVTGPVFYTPPMEQQVRSSLRQLPYNSETLAWTREFLAVLPELPVIAYAVFIRYVLMVHNTLTGQQLGLDALTMDSARGRTLPSKPEQRDRNKVYLAERALLQMVRNGDISYQGAFQNSTNLSPGVPVQGQDPLRQMKTSIVVFTTLVCRAAIEGGLSPEIAYPLGDSYIQSAEDSRDSGELNALSYAMYHDFIYRVHQLHANPDYSHAIQKCCDYIELSLDRKIRTSDLAALVGYAEYYLSEKFKKETGQSISSYIRYAKVERAKVLLSTTDLSIHDISERLAFSSVNFFIRSFRETAGYTPAQYRKKFQHTA